MTRPFIFVQHESIGTHAFVCSSRIQAFPFTTSIVKATFIDIYNRVFKMIMIESHDYHVIPKHCFLSRANLNPAGHWHFAPWSVSTQSISQPPLSTAQVARVQIPHSNFKFRKVLPYMDITKTRSIVVSRQQISRLTRATRSMLRVETDMMTVTIAELNEEGATVVIVLQYGTDILCTLANRSSCRNPICIRANINIGQWTRHNHWNSPVPCRAREAPLESYRF